MGERELAEILQEYHNDIHQLYDMIQQLHSTCATFANIGDEAFRRMLILTEESIHSLEHATHNLHECTKIASNLQSESPPSLEILS